MKARENKQESYYNLGYLLQLTMKKADDSEAAPPVHHEG
jgi:hypothetical protein